MSAHEGKKLVTAIQGFNAKATGLTPIGKLAQTLQKRTLGEKHFQEALSYLKGMREAATIKIADILQDNQASRLEQRKIDMHLLYMTANLGDNGQPLYDDQSPAICRATVANALLLFCQRPLPLTVSSQHTEFRFIQRTGIRLDYSSDDFQWATMTALAMALTIPKLIMEKTGQATAPVALPFANGLYLGHATLCRDDSFWPQEYVLSCRDAGGKPLLLGLENNSSTLVKPEWSPQCHLYLSTYISDREMYPDQTALYDRFVRLFTNPVTVQAYNIMMNSYNSLVPLEQPHIRAIQWLSRELETIYNAPEWLSIHKHGQKHLRRHELN